jgi:hypothetical protein
MDFYLKNLGVGKINGNVVYSNSSSKSNNRIIKFFHDPDKGYILNHQNHDHKDGFHQKKKKIELNLTN